MLFSLIVVILLIAIAFFQSTQGLFSALIMAVLSICCGAAAVGCYEFVAINYLAPYWHPNYSFAIALAALFGIPLVVLRAVTDKLVRRSCHVQGLLDRLGGGLCGLITAYTVVGMIALALENMPFGGSLFGFERVPRVPTEVQRRDPDINPPPADAPEKNLWMSPDRFVAGLGAVLSTGIFSGERSFVEENPDHIQHLGWVQSVPPGVPIFAPPNSISIVRTAPVKKLYNVKPGARNTPTIYQEIVGVPRTGYTLQMIRVALKKKARGESHSHFFTIRQFRIVGKDSSTGRTRQYHPIALQQSDRTEIINRYIRNVQSGGRDWPILDELCEPREDNNAEVEIVFELPTTFVPSFVEYKHGARAAVKLSKPADAEDDTAGGANSDATGLASSGPDATDRKPPSESTTDDAGRRRRRPRRGDTVDDSGRGGRARGVTTLRDKSFFGDALPLELKDYRDLNNLSVSRGRIQNGHLGAELDKQEAGSSPAIRAFEVDRDKRLLQLNMKRLHTRSGLGGALDLAGRTVQNYIVEDNRGNQYRIIGEYAIANVDGTQTMEVQYFPDQAGSIGGLGPFNRIKDRHLEKDYELVLLFLVDPGVTIKSFSAGGSAQRRDDLASENLVAPD